MLRENGVGKGDRVTIYMSMTPQLAFAVLACARIGAIHSVVFGGFRYIHWRACAHNRNLTNNHVNLVAPALKLWQTALSTASHTLSSPVTLVSVVAAPSLSSPWLTKRLRWPLAVGSR